MANNFFITKYYKEHYPYLAEKFEYNHWYCDTSELLYIHPNGLPVYFNLDELCKYQDYDPFKKIFTNPVLNEKEFIDMIHGVINNTYNYHIKDNENKYVKLARESFKQVKNDLREMYRAKMKYEKQWSHKLSDNLELDCKYLNELKDFEDGSVSTAFSSSYGYYDVAINVLTLALQVSPSPNVGYCIHTLNKNVNDFHNWILHMLLKGWVTREHINLMFSAYSYIIGKPRGSLYDEMMHE